MPELDPRIITDIGDRYAKLPSLDESAALRQQTQLRDMAINKGMREQADQASMRDLIPGALRGDMPPIR